MTREEVIAYIQEVEFGYLATVDADRAPRVRPVGIKTVYGDDLYFFTFSNTRKCGELAANPHVEVVWTDAKTLSQVRMRGLCSAVEDMQPSTPNVPAQRSSHVQTLLYSHRQHKYNVKC